MANPSPQDSPTDGLGVAAYIALTGTNLTNRAQGGLTVATEATPNDTTGLNGQGYGAIAGNATSYKPVAQYHLQLSLSSASYGGTSYHNTCTITAVLKDVENASYTKASSTDKVVWKSYNNPDSGAPQWYNPSPLSGYDGDVASAAWASDTATGGTGLITAISAGQAIIEVLFPTFNEIQNPAISPVSPTYVSPRATVGYITVQIVVDVVT